ncbi:hypothetical protein LOAG_13734, partial [Loa loa]
FLEQNRERPHAGYNASFENCPGYRKRKKTHDEPFIYKRKRPDCGRTSNHSSFSSHKETYQPKHKCENCNRSFARNYNLKKHKELCSRTSQKGIHECPYVECTLRTKNTKEYTKHKKTHGEPFIYECKEYNRG